MKWGPFKFSEMLENPFGCECGAGDYGETVDSDISLHQEQYLIYNIK